MLTGRGISLTLIATGKPKGPNVKRGSVIEVLGDWDVLPLEVFALQYPPIDTAVF
jgi:hypothetical protein